MPIPARVPESLRSKLTIVCINGKDCSACATTSDGTSLTASTRSFGSFAVRLDTVAPTVKPSNFANGKTVTSKTITVTFSDNLSGVASYSCFINGEWVLAEHDGKTASLTASTETMRKGRNKITFKLIDAVGNSIEKTWEVLRP